MLCEAADRYLGQRYGFAERQKIVASAEGFHPGRWKEFAELGWLGLGFPEQFGGSGGTIADIVTLMRCFGKALVVEPYLSTVMLGGFTVLNASNPSISATLLPKMIAGELQLALAFAEPTSGYRLNAVETMAVQDRDGYRLNGHKILVIGAPSADTIIVPARTSGKTTDRTGISLFLVGAQQAGMSMRCYATVDGRRAADVKLDAVRVADADVLGQVGGGLAILEETVFGATLALMGEAEGAIDGALALTVQYLNTREQFGKKLASYQALRQRVADMVAMKEETSALVRRALRSLDGPDDDRFSAAAAAKAYVGQEGMSVCKEAIQLHGAIAIADEYIVGHYLKRLVAVDRMFGNVDSQIDVFMDRFAPLASS